MFVKIMTGIKALMRVINPDEFMIRIMNLSRPSTSADRRGLVLLQIDGLSHIHLENAVKKGMMPNIARLIKKEGYLLNRLYSGIPSSTPSVQGELFYGVKQCVPAFSYRDKKTGKSHNMFDMKFAAELEERLKKQGDPLLSGGSAYGDIFSGGAAEAHFCVSAFGWDQLLRPENLTGFIVSVLLHVHIFLSSIILIVKELLDAIFDVIKALIKHKDPAGELEYIPLRVVICVLLRIVVGMGVRIDIARGLPVIHANFAGYDEQAHHKGPSSGIALWSLRGIDRVIGSILRAAHNSAYRDYEVFIYSDHGQEETVFYKEEYGMTAQQAIEKAFEKTMLSGKWKIFYINGRPHWRASLINSTPLSGTTMHNGEQPDSSVHVVVDAMGPVGHIYPPEPLTMEQKELMAYQLVSAGNMPVVMFALTAGKAAAITKKGKFILPDEVYGVLKKDHPFLKSVALDLVSLCHNPDSGPLIFLGINPEGKNMTFFKERGSHAGPGPNETCGFAMLPHRAIHNGTPKDMNISELRSFSLAAMGRTPHEEPEIIRGRACHRTGGTIRIMSYNVHGCMGGDGEISPERIARVIASHNPDIVAMQELKANETAHQAEIIAGCLSMGFHYHAPVLLKTGWHGNGVLSRYDIKLVKSGALPRLHHTPILEPRGALWVEIELDGHRLQLINTHLSLLPRENLLQAAALIGPEWAGSDSCKAPVVICGDLNATPTSATCRTLERLFANAQHRLPEHKILKTFPGYYPVVTTDHVFTNHKMNVVSVSAPAGRLERKASDHLPFIVDVVL
ncbi:MAG: endonuclease/exonuclease/phosphatase family protein [Spirochaetia bacterium]|nr:endonuclease/exonuclease/phosphatase family protein [Spirochaetia bacterium]